MFYHHSFQQLFCTMQGLHVAVVTEGPCVKDSSRAGWAAVTASHTLRALLSASFEPSETIIKMHHKTCCLPLEDSSRMVSCCVAGVPMHKAELVLWCTEALKAWTKHSGVQSFRAAQQCSVEKPNSEVSVLSFPE